MATVLDVYWRKARKSHSCQMCWRAIDPGERYHYTRAVDGGYLWTWKECAHCVAAVKILDLHAWWEGDDGIGPTAFEEYEPETPAEARIKADWETGWRDPGGALVDIPTATTE
ncbi:hypothetical protein ACFRAQ_34515 [Nocardia sp. NPDC056611]|uniref:hypothetical protein n=1 Tax=Nocardia sp. NPDC056611 TaxID=3345877 RepID=UPI00366C1A2B